MTNLAKLGRTAERLLFGTPPGPKPAPRPAPAPTGLYLGWGTKGYLFAGPEQHLLVLGPPRSGKTSRLLVPSVLRHRGPAVITSTKPDVLKATLATRQKRGRCWYWDPSATTLIPDGLEPLRWSPISDCEDWDQAVTRANALASAARPNPDAHDAHWIERAQALLAPLLHAAALAGEDTAKMLTWLHKRELTECSAILKEAGAARADDILTGLGHTDSRELSGIFSTADSMLAAYRSDAALNSTRVPNFEPARFATTQDTLYLVAPTSAQRLYTPLIVALLEQIRAAAYRWHANPPMLYALDEVANIAPLPDLPAILAEGGSQGLIVLACLQDLSQARARWGKAADGFLTLFTNKLLLPGIAEPATLKAVSALAGEIDVPVRTTNATDTLIAKRSTSWTTRRVPRLAESQIYSLPAGSALLISQSALSRVAI